MPVKKERPVARPAFRQSCRRSGSHPEPACVTQALLGGCAGFSRQRRRKSHSRSSLLANERRGRDANTTAGLGRKCIFIRHSLEGRGTASWSPCGWLPFGTVEQPRTPPGRRVSPSRRVLSSLSAGRDAAVLDGSAEGTWCDPNRRSLEQPRPGPLHVRPGDFASFCRPAQSIQGYLALKLRRTHLCCLSAATGRRKPHEAPPLVES